MGDLSREPVSLLISYWYFQNDGQIRQVIDAAQAAADKGKTVRILVDSGAFSAHSQGFDIRLADYASWLEEVAPALRDWLVGAITLDVLNDEAQSWDNWAALQRRGLDTIPVVHLHARADVVDRYVDAGVDWVALGAMVGQPFPTKFAWAAWIHRHLRDRHPHVRTHGLGATSQRMTETIPWWSVDSSSFGSGFRYGRARLYDPATRKIVAVPVDGSADIHRHGRLLRDVYGIDPAAVRKSGSGNRDLLLAAAARAVLLWQTDLRAGRPIPAPASQTADGPHIHAVNSSPKGDAATIRAATAIHASTPEGSNP